MAAQALSTALKNTSFLRVWQIVGDAKAEPPIPPMIPVSRSTWLNGCKAGKYPKPVKLSPRTTAWRTSDIQAFIDSVGA
jgi:hypothetical protein